MKQALISLFRTVVGARSESAEQQRVVMQEVSVAELRQVSGGVGGLDAGPRGGW